MQNAKTQLYKTQAKRLRQALEHDGLRIPHARALELVATVHGCKDWNTLCAQQERDPQADHPASIPEGIVMQVQASPDQAGFLIRSPQLPSGLPEVLPGENHQVWRKGTAFQVEQEEGTLISVVYALHDQETPVAYVAVVFNPQGTLARVMAATINLVGWDEALRLKLAHQFTAALAQAWEGKVLPFQENLDGSDQDVFAEYLEVQPQAVWKPGGMGQGRLRRKVFLTFLNLLTQQRDGPDAPSHTWL